MGFVRRSIGSGAAARTAVIAGAVVAVVFTLGGCDTAERAAVRPSAPRSPTPTVGQVAEPLPPPEALVEVLTRIADPNVPGTDKLELIESATPADAAAMDRFGRALDQPGYAPVTFEATELHWAQNHPGRVTARVTMRPADPENGEFSYPMEFTRSDDGWQLTRRTADALLVYGDDPAGGGGVPGTPAQPGRPAAPDSPSPSPTR